MNKKASSGFVNFILYGLAFMIFIFAAPLMYQSVQAGLSGQGTATAFVMKLFLWVILVVFIAVFYRIITGGDEGFFG